MPFFALFIFSLSIVGDKSFPLQPKMKQKLLIIAFALPLILINPLFAQSKDALKTIMTNQWVKKYKKLKTDLEDKAGFVKTLENVSEADQQLIKASYQQTSKMLDHWLDHLVASIEKNNDVAMAKLAEGSMDEELKAELLEIFSFYSNDFTTKYEEVTGIETKTVVTHARLMEDGSMEPTVVPTGKVERDFLISNVKKPLQPANWNALF